MSVKVNTTTNTVSVQNAHQTITIVDNNTANVVNVDQPLVNVIEVATPGPRGSQIDTSIFATTGSNNFIGNQSIFGDLYLTGSDSTNTTIHFTGGAVITTSGPNLDMTAGPDGWSELGSNSGQNYVWVDNTGLYLVTDWDSNTETSAWRIATSSRTLTAVGNLDMNGHSIFNLPTNVVPLSKYETNLNFGATLQAAINLSATGSVIDCTAYTGSQSITSSITINKPLTIKLGYSNINVNFDSSNLNTHLFNITNTSNVIIEGLGRSPKASTQSSPTVITMTNNGAGYHIFGTGSNSITIKNLDLIGNKSDDYNLATGVGGVCFIEPNPGVAQAGNTVNNITLSNLFINGTRDHGIYFVGSIMSDVSNCRVSNVGGHGFFTTEGSTSTKFTNCYASSGNLAGFCIHNTSYSTLENCAAESFGAGYWIRSSFNISLIGCGAESNTSPTALPNSDLGITFGSYTVDDWSTTYVDYVVGTSYLLTGGKNIVLNNPYSKDPGRNQIFNNTSHYTIASTNSGSILLSPRCVIVDSSPLNYDVLIKDISGTPRDLSVVFNPENQGTVTPTTPGQYITTTYNPGVTNTVICDEGINIEVKSGNKFYNTLALPNFTSNPTNITTGSMYLNPITNILYVYNGTAWKYVNLT